MGDIISANKCDELHTASPVTQLPLSVVPAGEYVAEANGNAKSPTLFILAAPIKGIAREAISNVLGEVWPR